MLGVSKNKIKLSALGQVDNTKVTVKTTKNPTFTDNNLPEAKIHVQRCAFLKHLTEIQEEDLHRVKWDTEYIQTIPEAAIKVLEKKWDELKDKIVVPFNKSGLTIEDCIKMCLAHDDTISKNKKHPLTEDQIKQNLANKKKQEESNKLKKSKNDESTIIN